MEPSAEREQFLNSDDEDVHLCIWILRYLFAIHTDSDRNYANKTGIINQA